MDKDNNHGESDFNDDARYDDALQPEVREEEYAAGQEEWDQPVDEFAEEEQHDVPPEPKRDPFAAEEGPLEDEYAEPHHEEHEHHAEHDHDHDEGQEHHEGDAELEDHHEEQPAAAARSAKPAGGFKPPGGIMKFVPYVVGGIAVLGLGFFGYEQLMGGSSGSSSPSLENQSTWDNNSASNTPHETQHASNANEFQQMQPTQQAPVEQPPAQQQPVASGNNMIAPVATPTEQPPVQQPVAQQPVQQPAQQAPLPTAAAQPNPLETRIAELTQQLDQMKQTQDQLNQKLAAATATPPSMDENSKAATQALNDRIAQLEAKLAAQPAAQPAPQQASSSIDTPSPKASRKSRRNSASTASADTRSASASDTSDQPAPSARKSKKASTDFMVAKKSRKHHRSASANSTSGTEGFEPVNAAPFQGWILRSAQPGSAWLSQGPYSSDLRRVVPGDKVQGLGTVTAIRQSAGRWVVEGTQGAVR